MYNLPNKANHQLLARLVGWGVSGQNAQTRTSILSSAFSKDLDK